MRRMNWPRYAAESPGGGARGFDHLAPPAYEREARSPAHAAGDHEEGEAPNLWSEWIDLGGEG